LNYIEFGIGQARRSWAEKGDVWNAGGVDEFSSI